ncbi:MAG: hypothetical protein JXP37_05430 [Coriobacteriia bacterium]|nr:hypothetical protein [Coriobacteriia bacterium]
MPALGPYGTTLYLWLMLNMNPQTRRIETTGEEMRAAIGTGTNQVSRSLTYLEAHGYIGYTRGNGRHKSIITILKPECPAIGQPCPLASSTEPCMVLEETVRETAKEVREENGAAADKRVIRVLKAWNAQSACITHRKLNDKEARKVLVTVKRFGIEEVCTAIANYAAVVDDAESWFNYRWTLWDFLTRKQGNNIARFSDAAEPLVNFRGKRPLPSAASDGKYDDL